MAQIIPEQPVGSVNPEVARVFHMLKGMPEDWRVWFHIAPWEPEAPDFLLVVPDRGALVLKVSRATPEHAQQAPQLQLLAFEQETAVPGEAEEQSLGAFLRSVTGEGVPLERIEGAVIFPNLRHRDLEAIQKSGSAPRYVWLDRTWRDRGPSAWEDLMPERALDPESLHVLRTQFTPETVVPASFVAQTHPSQRRHQVDAALGNYLLDYDQEAILKTDLDLEQAGEQLSKAFRIQVINGVAGSGKTLILLYRLRLLQTMFPRKSYQVLTHNRPLIREMQVRYDQLHDDVGHGVGWNTFMQWCYRHWPSSEPFNPISTRKRQTLVREVWTEYLGESGISQPRFESELGWVKDLGIAQHEAYMEVSRRGRGFRLSQNQRELMFEAIRAYQQHLRRRDSMDWWDVPRRYWHWIEQGRVDPPRYDVVLVDEAQFFAPVWFDIVREMVRPEMGYLFLAADPTQGFLRRGRSWKSMAGLEVRGRSHVLRRSYRTTRAILAMAVAFYRKRLPGEDPDVLSPDLDGMRKGRTPILLNLEAPQDERLRVVREITQAVERGLPLRHILILHASGAGAQALMEALNTQLGEGSARDPKYELPGDFIRVTTLNAGTGLESPVVFVTGLHTLLEREDSLRLSDEDRDELMEHNTRKLYMAFTRAGQRLVLTCAGDVNPSFAALAKYGLLETEA
jgi:hypothetical protein